MVKVMQTANLFPYRNPLKAGEIRRLRFTAIEELTDTSPPVIDVVTSSSDSQSFIEEISFTDDIGVSHVDVQVNGQGVSSTIKELPSNGVFTFYFDKKDTYNVTVTVYDFYDHMSSHYIYCKSSSAFSHINSY